MINIEASNEIPIFVLTMDKPGGARWVHCKKEFSKLGLEFIFVNGFKIDNPEITQVFSSVKNFFLVKRKVTNEEISCYLGHRKIWRQFLNSSKDVCLITEDDVRIRDVEAFKRIISFANDNDSWDILKLFDYNAKPINNTKAWNGFSIVDYQFPASGTVAYLTTRDAVNKLLSRKKIYRAIDDDWSNCWELGIRIRSIYPNVVEEASNILDGSLIEHSRSRNKKEKKIIRSLWGMVLQVIKQIRSKIYLIKLKVSENDT